MNVLIKAKEIMDNHIVEILLVEDNPDDAGLTIRALKKHNFANHLLHLKNGKEALDYLYDENHPSPKLILLDIKMPKVDGIEVLTRLKNDPLKKHIPIVMLTSSKEEKDLLQSYKLGVNAFVSKPVQFEGFMKAVADVGLFWLLLNQIPQSNA